jgi:hypothetical protein
MKATHLTTAAAIAAGIGIAALTGTMGIASAPPLDPRHVRAANLIRLCCKVFQPKCWAYGRVGPGSPIGGGRQPLYPRQCKAPAPAGGG